MSGKKKSGMGNEEKESSISSVVVSSNRPPTLKTCSSIISLMLFLEEYQHYVNQGGAIKLHVCLSPVVCIRLSRVIPGKIADASEDDIVKSLYKVYSPSSAAEFLNVLRSLRCEMRVGRSFDLDGLLSYTTRFVNIVVKCESLKLSRNVIYSTFLDNMVDLKFKEYLLMYELKDEDYDKWTIIIYELAEHYRVISAEAYVLFGNQSKKSYPKPVAASSPASDSSLSVVHSPSSSAVAMVAASSHGERVLKWSPNVCLGCGHVTNPPHRRVNCPHKSLRGWVAKGGPPSPPLSGVSLIVKSWKDVCLVDGVVQGRECRVGLDSMSSYSLISRSFVDCLGCGVVKVMKPELHVAAAGSGDLISVKEFVTVAVSIKGSPSVKLEVGIIDIPVDLLVGWSDIVGKGFWNALAEEAGRSLPEFSELAPEDCIEDFYDPFALIVASKGEGVKCVEMRELASEFPDVLSNSLPAVPAKVEPMKIMLKPDAVLPSTAAPRRQSAVVNKFIEESVSKYLEAGFIVPSNSHVASPVVVVRSTTREWRLCIDYRLLNAISVPNVYPLPNIKSMLERISGHCYYAKFDLKKGYHQVEVHPESRYLTAFVCASGVFEFKRLPFGLKSAPAYFQHLMATVVLAGLVHVICEVYIDDISIFADSLQELEVRCREVLERCRKFGICLHPDKCLMGVDQLVFLGHVVSERGIQISESKVEGVIKLEAPRSRAELRAVVGFINYFRDFIPNFSLRIAGMEMLLSPKRPFIWSESLQAEFLDVKRAIKDAGMIYTVDYDFPLVVRTDASVVGVGAVLFQPVNGVERPIAFVSQKFSGPATRWATVDQEAYAIVFAVKKLEPYLRGQKFIVQTDHKNLTYVLKSDVGRVVRWRLLLQEFEFVVEHIPGVNNTVADALSRCLIGVAEEVDSNISKCHNEIVGHHGVGKTLGLLRDAGLTWQGMRKDVVKFIQSCVTCQKSREVVHTEDVSQRHVIEVFEPFEEVSVDYIVNLPEDGQGCKCILAVVDNFTKYVELFPVKEMDAVSTAQCLLSVFSRYGAIKRIRSDRGAQFIGEVCSSLFKAIGCQQILTVGFRPQANGIVERVNGEIKRHLQTLVNATQSHSRWSAVLPLVQRVLNSTVHSSTGYAPSKMLFGGAVSLNREIISKKVDSDVNVTKESSEYVKELFESQSKIVAASQVHLATVLDRRVEKSRKDVSIPLKEFKAGDLVLSFRHGGTKLDMRWCGPFSVIERTNANIYKCTDLCTQKKVLLDVTTLKLFNCAPGVDPLVVAGLDESEFVVESILGHRLEGDKKKNKTHYYFLVKFQDGEEEWLPYMEVRELEVFSTYLKSQPALVRLLKLKIS